MSRSCASCGMEVSAEARFCPACGSSLWLACPACGREQAASAAFCSSCGAALREGSRRAAAVPEHEERRVVTVLFADLAGSTALGEQLEPEDVRTLQGELFDLVNGAVERHGGMTEKFVGDAVLAVFGVPQTHEDDAERAVRAALAVQESFPRFAADVSERYGGSVGLRVGVNTGEVIAGREAAARGELVVSGDVVNVAARLQQLAEPGKILVGDRTRLATQRSIRYGEPVDLDAKGKSAPLRAWQPLEIAIAEPIRPRGYGGPLLGRDEELEVLRLTAKRVERERSPQLVTIFGNAGVGKSRLVEEFCGGLVGARVILGRCVPYGDGITYLPLAEAASQLAGIRSDDRADVAVDKVRASVRETVGDEQADRVTAAIAWTLGVELPEDAAGIALAEDARRLLHDGWATYLSGLGRERLLVVVIDDVHWASEPLLDLLDHLVRSIEATAVLLLCPARPELLDTRSSWGTGRLTASSLTLGPLSENEAEDLLRALLMADVVPGEVVRAILTPAEGNPFFVEEMLAMLVEQGTLERHGDSWSWSGLDHLRLPDSIHGVIAARLDLLAAGEREALRRCSVMGRTFWPSAVGVDDDVIAGLARRALAYESPETSLAGRREFVFKHALTHEVAYATLPRVERRELHRRVGEWIAEVLPDRQAETAELIAYHFEQALTFGAHDAELARRAFDATLVAARAAVARGAYTTVDHLVERGLALAPSPAARADVMLLAGRADLHRGRLELAIERLDEVLASADDASDVAIRGEALGWRARACWLSGRWREAVASSEAAVATLEGLPESSELAWALARLSQIQMLRALPDAEDTARRAIDVARRTGAQAAEANARINLFSARLPTVAPSPEEVRDVVELAVGAGAHDESIRAVVNYLWSAGRSTPLEEIERHVHEATRELALGLATEFYEEYLRLSLAALVYVPAGRWAEAEAGAGHGPAGGAGGRLVRLSVVTGLAFRRGQLDVVDALLPAYREDALASEEPQRIVPMAAVALPRALIASDSTTVRELGALVSGLSATLVPDSALVAVARVLAAAGEADSLERLLAGLGPATAPVPAATRSVATGLLDLLNGRAGQAAAALLAAEETYRAYGRTYDAACIALEIAVAAERGGDAESAAAARARAQATLEPLGCVNPY